MAATTVAEKALRGQYVQHLELGLGKVRSVYDDVSVEFLSQFSEAHGSIWPHIRFANNPADGQRPVSELIRLADWADARRTFDAELAAKIGAWRRTRHNAQVAALNNTDADSLRAILADVALDLALPLGSFVDRWARFHGISSLDLDPKLLKRKIDKAVETGTIVRYRAGEWARIGRGANGTNRETWVYTLPGRFEQLHMADQERMAERKAAKESANALQHKLAGLGVGGVGVDQHGIDCDLTIPATEVAKLLDRLEENLSTSLLAKVAGTSEANVARSLWS